MISEERVHFADLELMLTRYCAKIPESACIDNDNGNKQVSSSSPLSQAFMDLLSSKNDYCIMHEQQDGAKSVHPLARWYGLRDFVVVSPTGSKSLADENQIRIILSSLHIAVGDSGCNIPLFLHVLNKKHHVYRGVCENNSTRLSFDIVHLSQMSAHYKNLTGLLDIFKGKIRTKYCDPAKVSVQFSYSLSEFHSAEYTSRRQYAFSEMNEFSVEEESSEGISNTPSAATANINKHILLPFGVSLDPVKQIILHCRWPQFAENVVDDSEHRTDLKAIHAPIWSIHCRYEPSPICFMSECLMEYLQLSNNNKNLLDMLGSSYHQLGGEFNLEKNPLDQLTESKISKLVSSAPSKVVVADSKKLQKIDGPLTEEQLMNMLYFMFPDAHADSQQHSYTFPDNDVPIFKV